LARTPDKKPYTGILAQPIPRWTVLTTPTDEELRDLIDAKMKALFVHYGLNSTEAFQPGPNLAAAWANLAWHLAREHVPGFRGPPRKRGKPATRKDDDILLVMNIELLKRRDKVSDRKAVTQIAARNILLGTEPTLLQRYKRAKKQFEPMSRLFDNIAAAKGREALVLILEDALSGDNKDTILSPA
jgi:hypothetical protein